MSVVVDLVVAGCSTVGALGGSGWRVWYVKSRRQDQKTAIGHLEASNEVFGTVESMVTKDAAAYIWPKVEIFVARLGGSDARDFMAHASAIVALAGQVCDAYAGSELEENPHHNPRIRHRRRVYVHLHSVYTGELTSLQQQLTALQGLLDEMERLGHQIDEIASLQLATADAIQSANSKLGQMAEAGWPVAGLQVRVNGASAETDDDEARELSAGELATAAAAAIAQLNYLSALRDLEAARKVAAKVRKAAVRMAAAFEQATSDAGLLLPQVSSVRRAVVRAQRALPELAKAYADACSAGLTERLGARLQNLDDIRHELEAIQALSPGTFDEGRCEATLAQARDDLGEIQADAALIQATRANLDEEMAEARKAFTQLQSRVAKVRSRAQQRYGDQKPVYSRLDRFEEAMRQLSRQMRANRPNPPVITARLEELGHALNSIDRLSRDIDSRSRPRDGGFGGGDLIDMGINAIGAVVTGELVFDAIDSILGP